MFFASSYNVSIIIYIELLQNLGASKVVWSYRVVTTNRRVFKNKLYPI